MRRVTADRYEPLVPPHPSTGTIARTSRRQLAVQYVPFNALCCDVDGLSGTTHFLFRLGRRLS